MAILDRVKMRKRDRSAPKSGRTDSEPIVADWHALVDSCVPLAMKLVGEIFDRRNTANDMDDIKGEAMLALIRAARTYDPDYRTEAGLSVQFSTYATHVVRNRLKQLRYVRLTEQARTTHLPETDGTVLVQDRLRPNETDLTDEHIYVLRLLKDARLTEQQSQMVQMHYMLGLSLNKVSELQGVSRNRVQVVLGCALAKLRWKAGVGDERERAS